MPTGRRDQTEASTETGALFGFLGPIPGKPGSVMSDYHSGFAEIKALEGHANLRVSLFGAGPAPTALLFATYRRADPLVVILEVRTPEEITVFRRVVLRCDLAAGMDGPIAHAGTRIRPTEGRMVEVAFTEDGASVAVRVPIEAARRFLALTYRMVSADSEPVVLGELAAQLAPDRG